MAKESWPHKIRSWKSRCRRQSLRQWGRLTSVGADWAEQVRAGPGGSGCDCSQCSDSRSPSVRPMVILGPWEHKAPVHNPLRGLLFGHAMLLARLGDVSENPEYRLLKVGRVLQPNYWPMWGDLGQSWPLWGATFGQIWSRCDCGWVVARNQGMAARLGRVKQVKGRSSPNNSAPASAHLRKYPGELGETCENPKLPRSSPKFAQVRPHAAAPTWPDRATSGRNRPTFGQVRPERSTRDKAQVGRSRPTGAQQPLEARLSEQRLGNCGATADSRRSWQVRPERCPGCAGEQPSCASSFSVCGPSGAGNIAAGGALSPRSEGGGGRGPTQREAFYLGGADLGALRGRSVVIQCGSSFGARKGEPLLCAKLT